MSVPSISDIKESDDGLSMSFKMSGVTLGVANGLRRILLGEVPMLCMDLIQFDKNTSKFDEDYLAHRIGMIPLESDDVENYLYKNECDCEYSCDRCTVKLECDVTNLTDKCMKVTNFDIKSRNENVKCSGIQSPLVDLAPGETIKFTAFACKGIGNEHAKFCPVTVCTCVYNVDKTKPIDIQVQQASNPSDFVFSFETISAMKCRTALRLALDVFIKKLYTFEKSYDDN